MHATGVGYFGREHSFGITIIEDAEVGAETQLWNSLWVTIHWIDALARGDRLRSSVASS